MSELLVLRHQAKLERSYKRLKSPSRVQGEFREDDELFLGLKLDSYAFIAFNCFPADDLTFRTTVGWPSHIPTFFQLKLERAIAEAVIDALFTGMEPERGCEVVLSEVRCEKGLSSVAAFRWATLRAMGDLQEQPWDRIFVPPKEDPAGD